jgi:hypothetical protein
VDWESYGSDRCSVLVLTGVFKFLFLTGINDNAQVEELHCFVRKRIFSYQVFTYPLLSLAFFFEDKLKSDKFLNPSCSPLFIAKIAFETLKMKYPRNEHVEKMQQFEIVANSTNNYCALVGVYFLQQSEGTSNCWELTCKKNDFSFPAGKLMRFEPLVPQLKEKETRIYATLSHHWTQGRYVCTTRCRLLLVQKTRPLWKDVHQ